MSVSVIIPSHNGLPLLRICIESLLAQSYEGIEIIVVDNGSSDQTVQELRTNHPQAKVIVNNRNLGFAKAVNQGITAATGEYLFLLNNDTALEKDCVEVLVRAMTELDVERRGRAVGLAPKIVFREFPAIIDAVGTGIMPNGTGYNVGVGQIDIGQFDRSHRVFGCCFAAAFFKTEIFGRLGLLDEGYFAYYEDIDWCFLANSRGFEFWTCPEAVVYHRHSATTRTIMAYEQKYYLLHKNRIRFMIKNFRKGNLLMLSRPIGYHILEIYHILRAPFLRPPRKSLHALALHLRILLSSMKCVPLLIVNFRLNLHRVQSDPAIWEISTKELPKWVVPQIFEDETQSPILSLEAIETTYSRLALSADSSQEAVKGLLGVHLLNRLSKSDQIRLPRSMRLSENTARDANFILSYMGNRYYIRKSKQTCILDPLLVRILMLSLELDSSQLKDFTWSCVRPPKRVASLLVEGIDAVLDGRQSGPMDLLDVPPAKQKPDAGMGTDSTEIRMVQAIYGPSLRKLFDESLEMVLDLFDKLGLTVPAKVSSSTLAGKKKGNGDL